MADCVRLLAEFDDRNAAVAAARLARAAGLRLVTTFAPAFDRELTDLAEPHSDVPGAITLSAAIVGGAAALAFVVWTARAWPEVPVGGKPLISLPPDLIVTFEMTVLSAAIAAIIMFLVWARRGRRRGAAAYDSAFSDARFGLLIACETARREEAIDVLARAGAVTCRAE